MQFRSNCATGGTTDESIPGIGNTDFFENFQTPSGAQTSGGTGGTFQEGKAATAWSWPLISIQCQGSECEWSYTSSTPYAFMKLRELLYIQLTPIITGVLLSP